MLRFGNQQHGVFWHIAFSRHKRISSNHRSRVKSVPTKNPGTFSSTEFEFQNFILRMRCRGRSRRRGRGAGVSAAGVHDDAGAFPGFNKPFASVRAVELLHEIIHVGDLFQQIGGVGVHFFQERAAVHNLPRGIFITPVKALMAFVRVVMRAAANEARPPAAAILFRGGRKKTIGERKFDGRDVRR